MKKPRVFRCYRCKELHNMPPKRSGRGWMLCAPCYEESQGIRRSTAELDEAWRARAEADM
jgi:hypothetical protein